MYLDFVKSKNTLEGQPVENMPEKWLVFDYVRQVFVKSK